MLRDMIPSDPRHLDPPTARPRRHTRLAIASVVATAVLAAFATAMPSDAAARSGTAQPQRSVTATAHPTASVTSTPKPDFPPVTMSVRTSGSGRGKTCQYTLLIHNPMARTRVDGMTMTRKLNATGVTAFPVLGGFQISSRFIPCSNSSQAAAGVRGRVLKAQLSSSAKTYLTVALSVVVGGVVTVVVALLLPQVAAALGLVMSGAVASVIAACIGGIAGNLVDKAINGGSARQIVVSSVIACAASSAIAGVAAFVNRNRPAIQSAVSQVLSRGSSNAASQSRTATESVFHSARSSFSSVDLPSEGAIVQQVQMSMGHASA